MPKRKRSTGGGIKNLDTNTLRAELERRQAELEEERAGLVARLEEVDGQLSMLGGARPKTRTRSKSRTKTTRGRRSTTAAGGSLVEVLQGLLTGRRLSVGDAAEAVLGSGYTTKSSAKNFRVMVNQTLSRDTRFRRVSRGVYTAR